MKFPQDSYLVKEVILDGLGGKNDEGVHRAAAHLDKNLKADNSMIKRSQSDESLLLLDSKWVEEPD